MPTGLSFGMPSANNPANPLLRAIVADPLKPPPGFPSLDLAPSLTPLTLPDKKDTEK